MRKNDSRFDVYRHGPGCRCPMCKGQRSADVKLHRERCEDLARQLMAAGARLAELEKERENFRIERDAARIRTQVVEKRVADVETALSTLLDAAERQAAGFPLEAEQWFAVRDFARARLPEKSAEEVERE